MYCRASNARWVHGPKATNMGVCCGRACHNIHYIQTGASNMIGAFNALLECLVTGLFAAVFIVVAARVGILPITLMVEMDDLVEDGEDD